MAYYFNTTLRTAFEDAVARTVLALKAEGFGIISDIDVRKLCKRRWALPFALIGSSGLVTQNWRTKPFSWKTRSVPCCRAMWLCRR